MGISFVLFLPMLWTDASDSWRLKSKYQRMIISGAGMAAELLLAGFSLLCWSLLPEGELKFIMFVLSGVTLISTILINLNPFMKFDGYYLLSDLVQTPNLQTRSITATLELIRKFLWGFSAEYVEELSSPTRKWFVLYGMSCLVYRLLLYVSIAIIVYNFAPSPYGLLLALLEVYWLIIFPVIKELKYIFSNRKVWIHSFSFKISLFIIMTAVVLILPTGNNISGVAIVRSAEEVTLSVSRSVKLVKSNIINFKEVKQGDLLYEFYSPELYQEQEELQARGQRLNNEYEHYITSSDQKNKAYFIKEEILGVISSLRNNYQEQQSLNILSPINGVVRDIPATLKNGDWLESKEFLGSVLGGGNIVEAFVSEYDVERINVGDQAVFYPNGTGYKPIKVVVEKISKNSVRNLPYPSLAAAYGGVIEVNNNSESHELKESLFKITLKPIKNYNINSFIIGDVVIKGNYQSWFSYIFIKAYSFILRELSF
jgi:putative peptide zinc metalloprotease protein